MKTNTIFSQDAVGRALPALIDVASWRIPLDNNHCDGGIGLSVLTHRGLGGVSNAQTAWISTGVFDGNCRWKFSDLIPEAGVAQPYSNAQATVRSLRVD